MAARHLGRVVGWAGAWAAVPALLGTELGRRSIGAGVVIGLAATAWLVLWLPRAAHGAFERASYARAARRYRLIARTAFTLARERAATLSLAACDISAGRLITAERLLAGFEGTPLDASERCTWLNNRACIDLEAGRDPHAALALVEAAVALRPDVPAVQHTRATALIAMGRFDEAIGALEAMRAGGELAPVLEALRCRELARAWEHKGQLDYAADYRDRARLVAR